MVPAGEFEKSGDEISVIVDGESQCYEIHIRRLRRLRN